MPLTARPLSLTSFLALPRKSSCRHFAKRWHKALAGCSVSESATSRSLPTPESTSKFFILNSHKRQISASLTWKSGGETDQDRQRGLTPSSSKRRKGQRKARRNSFMRSGCTPNDDAAVDELASPDQHYGDATDALRFVFQAHQVQHFRLHAQVPQGILQHSSREALNSHLIEEEGEENDSNQESPEPRLNVLEEFNSGDDGIAVQIKSDSQTQEQPEPEPEAGHEHESDLVEHDDHQIQYPYVSQALQIFREHLQGHEGDDYTGGMELDKWIDHGKRLVAEGAKIQENFQILVEEKRQRFQQQMRGVQDHHSSLQSRIKQLKEQKKQLAERYAVPAEMTGVSDAASTSKSAAAAHESATVDNTSSL
ncbi:hypothetical protein OIV83_004190 [Microbotryomycetes sp. JL201]|nr:hypothetical protein OIV83_004190 [Microbotryomycetes sp. JL201]